MEKKYKIKYQNKEYEIIQKENGKFVLPKELKYLKGSYSYNPKPAIEIILVVMKPLSEKTYVDQALKNKKGITYFDDCRIPIRNEEVIIHNTPKGTFAGGELNRGSFKDYRKNIQGRYPANLLISNDILNDGTIRKSGKNCIRRKDGMFVEHKLGGKDTEQIFYGDSGSYSRYFDLDIWFEEAIKKLPEKVRKVFPFLIVPKASKSEKNKNCRNSENIRKCRWNNAGEWKNLETKQYGNIHPTVKPLKLISYLITLGSRKDDIVLDPFLGSGTTALSCKILDRRYIGIENNEEYYKIALSRINEYKKQLELF